MPKKQYKCCICGKPVYRYDSEIVGKIFCSMKCVGASKKNGTILYCAMCDKPFYRRIGEQDIGVRKNQFCSKRCYFQWRAENSKRDTYLKSGSIHIHRIISESVLGRKLYPNEVVHHIDGDRKNNNPKNLAVFPSQAIHAKCHAGGMEDGEIKKYSLDGL